MLICCIYVNKNSNTSNKENTYLPIYIGFNFNNYNY